MNFPLLQLGLGRAGAAFSSQHDLPIPQAILSGMLELPIAEVSEALSLILLAPETSVLPSIIGKTSVVWLLADRDGRVSEKQIQLASTAGCAAIFTNDTALQNTGNTPVYRVANHSGKLRALEDAPKKQFPLGVVGPGFNFGSDSHPHYPWRAAVVEPVMKTFPCLSYLPAATEKDRQKSREYRAQCELSLLCGGVDGRVLPDFWEILVDGSCLVTERSDALEKLGFRDEQNCLFVTPANVISKCAGLLGNKERLLRIRENGRKLAHKMIASSGCEIIRAWWSAQRAGRPFTSELGASHRKRNPWDFLFLP